MSEEWSYGAGENIPGTPAPFPFGLISNAFVAVAMASVLLTIIAETNSWFPFEFLNLPGLYWIAVFASLVTGVVALWNKPWRGVRSVAWILVWLFLLTPVFPVAVVLLLLVR